MSNKMALNLLCQAPFVLSCEHWYKTGTLELIFIAIAMIIIGINNKTNRNKPPNNSNTLLKNKLTLLLSST